MALYKANNRHPDDDRILLTQDPGEFRSFGQRRDLGFNAIICPLNPGLKPVI